MQVQLTIVDEDQFFLEVYAEIEVTSPAQRNRGSVHVADDSTIGWDCRLLDPARPTAGGIDPQQITEAIRTSP